MFYFRLIRMIKIFFLVLSLFFFPLQHGFTLGFNKPLERKYSFELIVQLKNEIKAEVFIASENEKNAGHWQTIRCISEDWNIWLIATSDSLESIIFLARCTKNNQVISAQPNIKTSFRETKPNDVGFSNQWYLKNTGQTGGTAGADIQATLAWDVATGGKTPYGDDIVFALIDDGITKANPDLTTNIWQNPNEIANNGIDDDGNGFIDDINGWNMINKTNDVTGGSHGIEVAGVACANGNNSTGITSINWNVKLMTLKIDGSVDQIISAYDYVYKMRKLYNDTKGKRGAFIVATNSSFGNSGFAKDQPLWCSYYDSLGKVGVLNFGATDNSNKNVDVVGDLPSTCPSNYLVVVTATDANDVKNINAAYGPINVDIAAPGQSIYTLTGNSYGFTSGTSLSCPIAAGIAALAYSTPCAKLTDYAKSNPSGAALYLKSVMMNTVDKIPSLQDLIVSGGRVNAFKTLQKIMIDCPTLSVGTNDPQKAEANIKIFPNPTNNTSNWSIEQSDGINEYRVNDIQGRMVQERKFTTNQINGALDLQSLPNGVYFVEFRNSEATFFGKIVKF